MASWDPTRGSLTSKPLAQRIYKILGKDFYSFFLYLVLVSWIYINHLRDFFFFFLNKSLYCPGGVISWSFPQRIFQKFPSRLFMGKRERLSENNLPFQSNQLNKIIIEASLYQTQCEILRLQGSLAAWYLAHILSKYETWHDNSVTRDRMVVIHDALRA